MSLFGGGDRLADQDPLTRDTIRVTSSCQRRSRRLAAYGVALRPRCPARITAVTRWAIGTIAVRGRVDDEASEAMRPGVHGELDLDRRKTILCARAVHQAGALQSRPRGGGLARLEPATPRGEERGQLGTDSKHEIAVIGAAARSVDVHPVNVARTGPGRSATVRSSPTRPGAACR